MSRPDDAAPSSSSEDSDAASSSSSSSSTSSPDDDSHASSKGPSDDEADPPQEPHAMQAEASATASSSAADDSNIAIETAYEMATVRVFSPWSTVNKDNLEDWLLTVAPPSGRITIGWQENRLMYRSPIKGSDAFPEELRPAKKSLSWGKRGGRECIAALMDYAWARHNVSDSAVRPDESLPINWPAGVLSFIDELPVVKGYYTKL